MVNSKKKKTNEDNISIKEYQKKIPRTESDRRRYYIIFVIILLIIATIILVGKFGPSFFSFIAFVIILIFPMIFVFDANISKWYFTNKDVYEDDNDTTKKQSKKQVAGIFGTNLSPKYQDILVVVLMSFLCFIGIIILIKANKSLFNVFMAAVAFGTAGVLSSYGLSDKVFTKLNKKKQTKDAIKYNHTHKLGPLETSSGRKKKNLSNN